MPHSDDVDGVRPASQSLLVDPGGGIEHSTKLSPWNIDAGCTKHKCDEGGASNDGRQDANAGGETVTGDKELEG